MSPTRDEGHQGQQRQLREVDRVQGDRGGAQVEFGAQDDGDHRDDGVRKVEQAQQRTPHHTAGGAVDPGEFHLPRPSRHQQDQEDHQGSGGKQEKDAGGGGGGVDKPFRRPVTAQHGAPQAPAHADGQRDEVEQQGPGDRVPQRGNADVEDTAGVPHHRAGDEGEDQRDCEGADCQDQQIRHAHPIADRPVYPARDECGEPDRGEQRQDPEDDAVGRHGNEVEDEPQLRDRRRKRRQGHSGEQEAGEGDDDDAEHHHDVGDRGHGEVAPQSPS